MSALVAFQAQFVIGPYWMAPFSAVIAGYTVPSLLSHIRGEAVGGDESVK